MWKVWESGMQNSKLALGRWFFKNKVFKYFWTAKCLCCPPLTTGIVVWTWCPFQISLWFGILNYGECQFCSLKKNWLRHCVSQKAWLVRPIHSSPGWSYALRLSFWLLGSICSSLGLDFLIWIMECPLSQMKVANIDYIMPQWMMFCKVLVSAVGNICEAWYTTV